MGTKYKGTESEVLSLNAYITLLRSCDTISNQIANLLNKKKLTMSQFGVLESLYYIGPLCQREIGTKILKSTANITTVIDNLEKRSLVKRVRQEDDRRYITVNLTDKGRTYLEAILPLHMKEIFTRMEVLTEAERKNLYNLCKKLGTTQITSEDNLQK
jgi:MarR family transcriptional regulator, 2-MHQ and catechol-resistance regulon repressor